MFEKVEEFLSGIEETLSKVDLANQSTISQESISNMVSNIESNIKVKLARILSLVLRLPTNAPCVVQVFKRGERGVGGAGSSKDFGEDIGVVFGNVISTQIPFTIPMMPIPVYSTTITTTANELRVPLKGISITKCEGGSSKSLVETTSTIDPKDKRKVIIIEQSDEEKKKQQAAELEYQKKLNRIFRQRENDPPSLKTGDTNKH